MKTNKVKAQAYCIGIKGRDRKENHHGYKIGYLDFNDKDKVPQEVIDECVVRAKVWSKGLKNPMGLRVVLTNVELDDGMDFDGKLVGMTSESYMMMNDKTIKIEL